MAKITLEDTVQSAIAKMAGGNPGAISAMADIMMNAPTIDPQAAFGGIGPILDFDTLEIYGTNIYIIWNDKCDRDARKVCVLLRAVQLGILPHTRLKEMASDQMRKVNLTDDEWRDIDSKVCAQLDQFQRLN